MRLFRQITRRHIDGLYNIVGDLRTTDKNTEATFMRKLHRGFCNRTIRAEIADWMPGGHCTFPYSLNNRGQSLVNPRWQGRDMHRNEGRLPAT